MADKVVSTIQVTGQTLYAFPDGASLADWTTYRQALTEGTGANTGRYTATLSDTSYTLWRLFIGSTQPASWTEAIETFDLDVSPASLSSDTDIVTEAGQIDSAIIIGDDYKAANGRDFRWTVSEPTGFTAASCSCWFGGSRNGVGWNVQGTITDNGATWTLSFDLLKTDTAGLEEGIYRWSVEVRNASGVEITKVRNADNRLVKLVEKQT